MILIILLDTQPKTRIVRKPVKPSPFNFSEIHGAPHPMPNDYIKRLPRFSWNNPIQGYLDIFWLYMESWGAKDEDVYMHALGAALDGDAKLWFNHFEPRTITGYDMFTDLLKKKWGKNIDNT